MPKIKIVRVHMKYEAASDILGAFTELKDAVIAVTTIYKNKISFDPECIEDFDAIYRWRLETETDAYISIEEIELDKFNTDAALAWQ